MHIWLEASDVQPKSCARISAWMGTGDITALCADITRSTGESVAPAFACHAQRGHEQGIAAGHVEEEVPGDAAAVIQHQRADVAAFVELRLETARRVLPNAASQGDLPQHGAIGYGRQVIAIVRETETVDGRVRQQHAAMTRGRRP